MHILSNGMIDNDPETSEAEGHFAVLNLYNTHNSEI